MTAVEFLEEKLKGDKIFSLDVIITKAKEMEKQQAERMYSEEQLRKSFHVGRLYQGREADTTFEDWFEQFKKK